MAQVRLAAVPGPRTLVYAGFRFHDQGLAAVGSPTRAQWVECLRYLVHLEQHVHFWIGDLLTYGESRWGATYTDMIEGTDYDYGTLRNLKWVAGQVAVAERRENLSFAHHQQVVRLPAAQQRLVLARAEKEGWTSRGVRQESYRLTQEVPRPQAAGADPGLHHGDCRDVLDRIPDSSVDLLVTDPPYGMNYVSPGRTIPFPHMVNDDAERAFTVLDDALAIAVRKVKPSSHVYVFTTWKTYRQMVAVVANHFTLRNTFAWVKNNWGIGDLEGNYGNMHELILFAHNGRRRFSGPGDANVLHFDRVGSNALQHPTQKPVALLEYLIGMSSRDGDTVLDPFMGSGSSCVAARKSRRRYIGVEIDQQWYQLALQRVADPTSEE